MSKCFIEFGILILYCYKYCCLIDKIQNNKFLRIAELGGQYRLLLKAGDIDPVTVKIANWLLIRQPDL